ncbi:hypothetical protein SLEP1_g45263 [Rubroshorea leprosula]|uniref:RNA-directed DNA polymerase n=1 Tax=Rubroshorea leprosula TaxID=152421 RepID=A0AAV5LII2_9ROSI|nr:hypothetical protein SLEP1_g45263 [Rubroshorea leprosula]
MAMGKILARLIPDDPLIPLLNRDAQLAAVVATQNSPTLSNIVVPTKPRGSGKLNNEHSSSKHSEELIRKNVDLERQLRDVQKFIDELKSPRSHQQTLDLDSAPLNLSITTKPCQEGFKIPHLETYDGSGDPDEHLHTYQAIMRIQNANDAMMCKVFPATLKSTARRWYHKLPKHSIDSYSQLAKLFSNKFASQKEIKCTVTELMQVHKKEGESMRDYMQRFNKATLDIDNVPDTICLSALLHGLKHGWFLDDLLENPPKTWNEVNDRSASFILSEGFQSSKRRANDKQSKSHEQPSRREERKSRKSTSNGGSQLTFQKDCQHLKDELEFLARNGKLEAYVQKPYTQQPSQTHFVQGYDRPQGQRGRQFNRRGQGQRTATQNQKDRKGVGYTGIPLPSGTINMISGGIHSGGQSARGRKAYAHQVFIDTGSSPDILYWSCFQKMQLNPSSLQKYEGPIYGFDNQPIPVEGVITLPICVGLEPRFKMASVSFLVIKMESAFNAILGRATLCELKVVISQPHLGMKFPTLQRVGALKGNQKMARACYQDTFKKVELAVAPAGFENHKPTQLGFIRRVEYSEWVSNPVLVKKPSGKWRMCIDFTNLNEACPKDPHPLPNVEKLVERAVGHERMSFLDASLGYHQVQLLLDDQEKTTFYAGDAIYYYVVMPFDLKNVGVIYQKLVKIIFKLQIGRNIEVYVDDMIVTSVRAEDHIDNLNETFQNLRRAQMKLNPLKCTFAVESGKFLGTVKDVQRLTGHVATLHRFIARLAEKCLLFFKALREPKNFQWTDECQQAFDELKQYLASAPLLSKPVKGESLQGAEHNYPLAEKAAFALLYSAHKLRAYFQSHQIVVYTDLPLRKILQKQELSGRLIRWSVEMSEYDLKFQPRTTIKGQAVVDFLVECLLATMEERAPEHPIWVLYVDGGANIEGSGVGAVIKVFSDSQLMVGQGNGSCEIKDPQLGRYAFVVNRLKSRFASFQIDKIPRTTSLIDYLQTGELLEDPSAAKLIKHRAAHFTLLDNQLYKRAASMPLLRCLIPFEVEYAMREVHEGVCGTHIGGRTLARKLLRHGYYWPIMVEDAQNYVKKCLTCQFNVDDIHMPVCGLARSFVYRFGIPKRIIADNGPQFRAATLSSFCNDYGIELALTSVYTPQSNGQAESANKIFLRGLKTRVLATHSNWVDKLNKVL